MRILRFGFALALASLGAAQSLPSNLVVLPANTTEATFNLQLPRDPEPDFAVRHLPLTDAAGHAVWPEPVFSKWEATGRNIQVSLSNVYVWGSLRLPVQTGQNASTVFSLQRGPSITPVQLAATPAYPAELWLYNFEARAVPVAWRIMSGPAYPGAWTQATLNPVRSEQILFSVPMDWFSRKPGAEQNREAELQLRFGEDSASPTMSIRLNFSLHSNATVLVPAQAAAAAAIVKNLIWVTFGVTVGAILLMMAQVMIPNYRQILKMETRLDDLQERLRAVTARVGSRLYTRCEQELDSLRMGLVMPRSSAGGRFLWWKRLLLSGNTAEVSRLSGVLGKIESRIGLTERLDEREAATAEIEFGSVPPSVCWDRRKQLASIRAILSRQFVTDAEEKSASACLDALGDGAVWVKAFGAELDTRIAALRRQMEAEPFKTRCPQLTAEMAGCGEILQGKAAPPPEGGWTISELIARDLAAVRLEIVYQMVMLEKLLEARDGLKESLLKKLESNDPIQLNAARVDLAILAEGIFEENVRLALQNELWDSYGEPTIATNQDVLRASLIFRDKDIQRCAAKDRFWCEWRISQGDPADDEFEQGWCIQLMRTRGVVTLTPEVYEKGGTPVKIRQAPGTQGEKDKTPPIKGQLTYEITQPAKSTLSARVTRGFVDAILTAIVPVVTVALTQVQNGGTLGIDKLVLIGFTSQAIRAAIVPESGSAGTDGQQGKGGGS